MQFNELTPRAQARAAFAYMQELNSKSDNQLGIGFVFDILSDDECQENFDFDKYGEMQSMQQELF